MDIRRKDGSVQTTRVRVTDWMRDRKGKPFAALGVPVGGRAPGRAGTSDRGGRRG